MIPVKKKSFERWESFEPTGLTTIGTGFGESPRTGTIPFRVFSWNENTRNDDVSPDVCQMEQIMIG